MMELNKEEVLAKVRSLSLDNVRSTYSGKAMRCCCGCAGKHSYNRRHVAEASKDRGYDVGEDEVVADRWINRVIKIIQTNERIAEGMSDSHVCVTVGQRLYIAYFRHDT
jgi:hypothetical protein